MLTCKLLEPSTCVFCRLRTGTLHCKDWSELIILTNRGSICNRHLKLNETWSESFAADKDETLTNVNFQSFLGYMLWEDFSGPNWIG